MGLGTENEIPPLIHYLIMILSEANSWHSQLGAIEVQFEKASAPKSQWYHIVYNGMEKVNDTSFTTYVTPDTLSIYDLLLGRDPSNLI